MAYYLLKNVLKKGDVSKAVTYIFIAAICAIVPYLLCFFIRNPKLADIVFALYLSDLNFSLSLILLCVKSMEKNKKFSAGFKHFFRIYLLISVLDSVFLITNFKTGFAYSLVPYYLNGHFYCWKLQPTGTFHIHIALCCFMALVNIIRMIRAAVGESKIYRGKFISIASLFAFVFILNEVFLAFPSILIDFSLPVYGICAISLYRITYYMIPAGIRQNLLSIASESITDAVFCFDYNNECIYQNKPAREINNTVTSEWMAQFFESGKDSVVSTESFVIDGKIRIFDLEFHRLKDTRGNLNGSYIKLNDRTRELQEMEQEQYRATHDELTGLYNRTFFFSEAERIIKENPDVPRYMIATDIRDFKLFNDLYGSTLGDNILKKQAEMLRQAHYEGCIQGRISGDKFAMLIAKENFRPDLAMKNTEILKEYTTDINFQLLIFIGVYEIANPFENVHKMYDKANLACRTNDDVTNTLSIYDTSLMKLIIDEKRVVNDFKSALENDMFCMFLQPQIESKTGKCVGAEALVRWYDAEKGYRPPVEFIHILEKSGLIYQLDHYIWEKAARKLAEYRDSDFYISVNISVKDFYYADLYLVFTGLVEKYDISPSRLNLEITETILIGNDKSYRQVLKKLQDYGFNIEMDDFGSGYSSLTALKEVEMDVLKIDMEFLKQTDNEVRGNLIVQAIVKMAKALGMTVVSEGVETKQQEEFLKSIGVDLFQGYFYSKPIPSEEFEHKYLEGSK